MDAFLPHYRDRDGIQDNMDNCPDVPNAGQLDTDGDKIGEGQSSLWLTMTRVLFAVNSAFKMIILLFGLLDKL